MGGGAGRGSNLYSTPTTWPRVFTPRAIAAHLHGPPPGSAVTSIIVPLVQRKACPSSAVEADPTTCPDLLMATAKLEGPPSVPRSIIEPSSQRKAWSS